MSNLPPGPRKSSLIQLFEYVANPYEFYEGNRRIYGDVFTMHLPGIGRQVVVASREGLKELTSGGYDVYERSAEALRYMVGPNALLFQEGQPHRRLRNVVAPALHGARMRGYGPLMMRVSDRLLSSYRSGDTLALVDLTREVTSRVILHCVFGMNEGPKAERLYTLLTQYAEASFSPWAFAASMILGGPRLHSLFEWLGRAQRNADPRDDRPCSRYPILAHTDRLGAIDAILRDEVEQCRRSDAPRDDVLSVLALARDDEGRQLTHAELRDQLLSLLLGGHDTISASLCWAACHLARNPSICARLRQEQAEVFPHGFDARRADELPYLNAVIKEALRLTPAVVGMGRRAKRDMRVGGYDVPAGTFVLAAAALSNRDPMVWDDPGTFRPERFLKTKPALHTYFPFGAGLWRCVGAAFAEYEMRVVLSRLVATFELEALDRQLPKPAFSGITIWPDGGQVRVRKVSAAAAPHVAPTTSESSGRTQRATCPFSAGLGTD